MESVSEWAAMDGYGFYVWGSYAVTAVMLGGLALWSWLGLRARRATLATLEAATPRWPANDLSPYEASGDTRAATAREAQS